jgi:NAD(P)-dependent dehydrogenase (short-subunit alcohol dehydrogenase family)
VRVNTLYPGFIDTDMTHAATEFEPFVKSKLQAIPMGRFGTVDDCAYGVLYLASDASSFMCGQHLVIDGGELA